MKKKSTKVVEEVKEEEVEEPKVVKKEDNKLEQLANTNVR